MKISVIVEAKVVGVHCRGGGGARWKGMNGRFVVVNMHYKLDDKKVEERSICVES